jgi:hypothetical protein
LELDPIVAYGLAVRTYVCDALDPTGEELKRPGPLAIRWFAASDGQRALECAWPAVEAAPERSEFRAVRACDVARLPVKTRVAVEALIPAG